MVPATSIQQVFGDLMGSPLLWSLGDQQLPEKSRYGVEVLWDCACGNMRRHEFAEPLFDICIEVEEVDLAVAIESIAFAWCDRVLESVDLQQLIGRVESSRDFCLESDPLLDQLLHTELALTLAFQSEADPQADLLWRAGSESMNSAVTELLDDEGWLSAKYLEIWQGLVACWTRCCLIADQCGRQLLSESATERFEWLIRQSFRLSAPQNRLSLAGDSTWPRDLIQAMCRVSSDDDDKAIANALFLDPSSKTDVLIDDRPGSISERAGIGILRSAWKRKSSRVAVRFDQPTQRFQIARQHVLLKSQALPRVTLNGKACEPCSDWQLVCWHGDERAEFLELQIELHSNLQLNRLFLLLVDDDCLLVADAIKSVAEARIDYQSWLELGSGIDLLHETENSEIYLKSGNKVQAMVLPLNLSEWASANTESCLTGTNSRLELTQGCVGKAMFAPLWFDLKPSRCHKPRTWRKLTVGESLRVVDDDEAVAYRIRAGKQQWLIYRSLEEVKSRTFLGENHFCDFFAGRFKRGNVEEIVTVE